MKVMHLLYFHIMPDPKGIASFMNKQTPEHVRSGVCFLYMESFYSITPSISR